MTVRAIHAPLWDRANIQTVKMLSAYYCTTAATGVMHSSISSALKLGAAACTEQTHHAAQFSYATVILCCLAH